MTTLLSMKPFTNNYLAGVPLPEPTASIALTTSIPSITLPKTTWWPSNHWVFTYSWFLINDGYSGDEELRTISVGTSVSHGQETRTSVLQLEVFISELFTIDAFTSSTVTVSEVTTLNHEAGDNTMEDRTLVVKRLTKLANALFTSTQSTEVFNSLRNSLTETT